MIKDQNQEKNIEFTEENCVEWEIIAQDFQASSIYLFIYLFLFYYNI